MSVRLYAIRLYVAPAYLFLTKITFWIFLKSFPDRLGNCKFGKSVC